MSTVIPVLRKRLVIEATYSKSVTLSIQMIQDYLQQLSAVISMTIVHGPLVHNWAHEYRPNYYDGYEGWVMWAESGCQFYTWERYNFITIDLFTCKDFDIDIAVQFTREYFQTTDLAFQEIPPLLGGPTKRNPNNHPSVIVKEIPDKGLGLVAIEPISKGEIICVFDGQVIFATSEQSLYNEAPEASQTAAPFHKHLFRNGTTDSFSRFINHSCEPNCGIRDLFTVITMRDIAIGEELSIDYGMICNDDWQNPEGVCLCGAPACRGKILPYRELPESVRAGYKGYISEWIEPK